MRVFLQYFYHQNSLTHNLQYYSCAFAFDSFWLFEQSPVIICYFGAIIGKFFGYYIFKLISMFQKLLLAFVLLAACLCDPLMLQQKEDFISTITKTNIAVFYYGRSDSEEYQAYEGIIPSDKELFSGLEFYFIPADKIKISRKENTLFIFRNIEGNQWLTYDGPLNTNMMSEWVRHNCFDAFPELSGEQVDELFVQKKKGFILLDFGQFDLLSTKIVLNDFCRDKKLLCGKCTIKNKILGMVIQLMRAEEEPGVSRLAFWDPTTSKFTQYTKVPLPLLKYSDLEELVEGREGLVKPDITPSPPEEQIQLEQEQETQDEKGEQESESVSQKDENSDL